MEGERQKPVEAQRQQKGKASASSTAGESPGLLGWQPKPLVSCSDSLHHSQASFSITSLTQQAPSHHHTTTLLLYYALASNHPSHPNPKPYF